MVLGRLTRSDATTKQHIDNSSIASTTSTARDHLLSTEDEQVRDPPSQFEQADWISVLPETEHVRLFRSVEWWKTPLSALETWTPALRLHVSTCLADSRPGVIYW